MSKIQKQRFCNTVGTFKGKHHTDEIKRLLRFKRLKHYVWVSPNGERFETIGLEDTIKKYSLKLSVVREYLNKGVVPLPRIKATNERNNTSGWTITTKF